MRARFDPLARQQRNALPGTSLLSNSTLSVLACWACEPCVGLLGLCAMLANLCLVSFLGLCAKMGFLSLVTVGSLNGKNKRSIADLGLMGR